MRLNHTGGYDEGASDSQRSETPDWKEEYHCEAVCEGCRCGGYGVDAWECAREYRKTNAESRRLGRLI